MPFLDAQGHVCVEDPRAPAYNRIVDGAADATLRGEALDRADGLYDVAILIDHNGLGSLDVEPRRGRGSCTFLHIWKRKGRSTAGGTAMARDDLDKIVDWLDPKRRPVLVQLPKRELIMKRGLWGIP